MSDLYHEHILEEARDPQCQGVLPTPDQTLHGTNASCGDVVTITITFSEPGNPSSPISDIAWTGQGCVISQAAMSVLAGKIKAEHLTLAQVAALTESDLESMLGLSEVSIGRIKCLLLGLRTLQSKV